MSALPGFVPRYLSLNSSLTRNRYIAFTSMHRNKQSDATCYRLVGLIILDALSQLVSSGVHRLRAGQELGTPHPGCIRPSGFLPPDQHLKSCLHPHTTPAPALPLTTDRGISISRCEVYGSGGVDPGSTCMLILNFGGVSHHNSGEL